MERDQLNVAMIQSDLIWEQPAQNRLAFEKHFTQLPENCDLAILPEMFTTGFSMNPGPLAETMDGITVQWMKAQAKKSEHKGR